MDSTAELLTFVRTAKTNGVPDATLLAMLRGAGWSERRAYRVLTTYYAESLGLTPPSRGGGTNDARDALAYLLNFLTLAFWTIALGQLAYTLIERRFPDIALGPYGSYSIGVHEELSMATIAWQLASIIIGFPAFIAIDRYLARELVRRPDLADSGVRAWLTSVALVLAAITVLTDGVWFLNSLLRGQLTTRFVLDSLVLLVIGGGIFASYLPSLRAKQAH